VLEEVELAAAAERRREDLLVHSALGILNRTRSASRPSSALVRDMRALFGSQQEMAGQAMDYLQALADPQRTLSAMQQSAGDGHGLLDEDGRLVVLATAIDALAGALRCYIGCAMHFVGEIEGVHLVRLDPLRKRLVIFPLVDPRSAFPTVERTIAVDLKRQDVAFRDERRMLVRKADVFGMSLRSKQRLSERKMREERHLDGRKVLARLPF
jgi:DNA phosphorothioation-associated putative methyltransferase